MKIVIGVFGIPDQDDGELEKPITEQDIADLEASLIDNGVEE